LKSIPGAPLNGQATGIEVIQDPHLIERLYHNLVRSAKEEIMLVLPTTSAFVREEKIGIIKSLHDAAARGVKVKILTPTNEQIEPKMQPIFKDKGGIVELRTLRRRPEAQASLEPRTKILIIDRKEYLVVELKDDSKEIFIDAVRLALYSATKSTVISYLTLFESLWEQTAIYDQLLANEKMQEEFLNIAAHELRTPIQPLIGMLEILDINRTAADEDEVHGIKRKDVKMIARNVSRLERLSESILNATRIEGNRLKLNKERFDLNEKIKDIINDINAYSERNTNLNIEFKQTDRPLIVLADKARIYEVISNVLLNAVKFSNKGIIKVTLEKLENLAIISIRDSGEGIDPDVLPRLFTRFATGKNIQSGSGLGLYISKGIIEAHGGTISGRNNQDGKGATFSFTLPIA
jgi:signal transduction histidine kinase